MSLLLPHHPAMSAPANSVFQTVVASEQFAIHYESRRTEDTKLMRMAVFRIPKLLVLAYWKFESISLQQRVGTNLPGHPRCRDIEDGGQGRCPVPTQAVRKLARSISS